MSRFILFIYFSFLAVRALAFNITVGSQILSPSDILDIPDSPVKTACNTNCSDTSSKFTACNDDANCLCGSDTVASLLACETCMFQFLINVNQPAPDFRAGSNPVLGAYATACLSQVNVTLAASQTALILPSTWDGPFVAILPVGGAAVTVIVGAVIGISALLILSNL